MSYIEKIRWLIFISCSGDLIMIRRFDRSISPLPILFYRRIMELWRLRTKYMLRWFHTDIAFYTYIHTYMYVVYSIKVWKLLITFTYRHPSESCISFSDGETLFLVIGVQSQLADQRSFHFLVNQQTVKSTLSCLRIGDNFLINHHILRHNREHREVVHQISVKQFVLTCMSCFIARGHVKTLSETSRQMLYSSSEKYEWVKCTVWPTTIWLP